jgi:hypothetical protein
MSSRLARSLPHVRRWRADSRPVTIMIDLIECFFGREGERREREGGERRSRIMTSHLARSLRRVRSWRDGNKPVRKIMDLIDCFEGWREVKIEREGEREKREREG